MDIVAALRSRAEMSAKAMQLMAQSKSERNQAAGDVGASYDGGTKEQTVEWRAADEIERLRRPFRHADALDWAFLMQLLPDTGQGKFWKEVLREARVALQSNN